jgi:hypothetical protein
MPWLNNMAPPWRSASRSIPRPDPSDLLAYRCLPTYVYPALVDTGLLCECHSFVGDGALVAESALAALGVVEGLDVIEEGGP